VPDADRAGHGLPKQTVRTAVFHGIPHFSRSKSFISCTPTRGAFRRRKSPLRAASVSGQRICALHANKGRTKALRADMPERAQIVALRTGKRRGTAISSCVQKRGDLIFCLRGLYSEIMRRFLAISFMSGKLTDAERIEWRVWCSFHSPKWMNCLDGVRFQVRLPCGRQNNP
jgi:hypothetical protein